MNKISYYFAYGSNMNISQMALRCPGAKVYGVGAIQNYKLLFKAQSANSYATIEPCAGAFVPVVIWMIEEQDERNLDRYENYPILYSKTMLTIEAEDKKIEGMVYTMNDESKLASPAKEYFESILCGYQSFDLDTAKLYEALSQR